MHYIWLHVLAIRRSDYPSWCQVSGTGRQADWGPDWRSGVLTGGTLYYTSTQYYYRNIPELLQYYYTFQGGLAARAKGRGGWALRRARYGTGGTRARAKGPPSFLNILILPQSRLYASQSDPEQPLMEKQIAAKNYYYVGCKSGMGTSYSSTPPKESVYLPI